MHKSVVAALMLIAASPSWAANFEIYPVFDKAPARETKPLSPEKLALRDAMFQQLRTQSENQLEDGGDAQLKGKLAVPAKYRAMRFETSGEMVGRMKKADTVFAFVVEPTGAVSWVTVLESSGDEQADAAAQAAFQKGRFSKPASLDGKPVRVYLTSSFLLESITGSMTR